MNPQPMYTQQELDAKLLAAANALRGPVDPADFKAYIFPLLFLKRISDTWHWEYKKALALYDGDEDLARLPENFRFEVPDGCLWDDVLKLHENIGAGLQLVFDRLQEANPETLAGVFGTVQWANKQVLPEERLLVVLDVFTSLQLDPESVPHDLLGNGYEFLLKNFADESGKKAGEFFTPRPVVRLLIHILDPRPQQSVYDPTCGSGGMLVEAVNTVESQGGDPRTLRLYGQEVNATTGAIARMNLYVHDIETFDIKRGDTLLNPRFRKSSGALETFDVIVANPPFSLGKETPWGHERWADDPWGRARLGVPPKSFAELAFVEHMLSSMDEERGRVAVIVPQGVLSRPNVERTIRRNLLKSGALEAVIGLAPNLFYGTTLAACALVCRARLPDERAGRVLFIDASARFKKGVPKNLMTDEDVDVVLRAYETGESPEADSGVNLRSVETSEISDNNWDLTLGRYVTVEDVAEVDLALAVESFAGGLGVLTAAQEALAARLSAAGFNS